MKQLDQDLSNRLYQAKIFGPDSPELIQQEKSLIRYLEKEYRKYLNYPVDFESTGISTYEGPIVEQTKDLMEEHYDERIDLFTGFLDTKYRAYTMAYYGEEGDADASLEEAQHEKFKLIAERAQITGHESILNIGCGFGPLETYLLERFPNISITSITPSKVQAQYIEQKMQDKSHPISSGLTLIQGVFDETLLDTLNGEKYDLVISIGFFEHALNMHLIFEIIAQLLKPDGRMFHHFITSKVATPQVHLKEKTVIGKYFPGGRVWPHTEICRHTERFDLANSWFINGMNYWRTLDEWHHRYWCRVPELYNNGFDINAIQHWNEYFLLCKAMFAPLDGAFYGNSHYLFKLK